VNAEVDTAAAQTDDRTGRQRFLAGLPTGLALLLIGGVWFAGAVWSFEEQTRFAESKDFQTPQLLPLVLDGMAIAMAAVAYAASLDARPAVFARLGTALAIACSAASNAAWAWVRSDGDLQTIVLAAGVPVVAMVAFEVLLGEVRRQVLRRRGQPAPAAVPAPRLIRLVLAPFSTFVAWRRLALAATDPRHTFAATDPKAQTPTAGRTPVAKQTPVAIQTPQSRQTLPADSASDSKQTPVAIQTPTRKAVAATPARPVREPVRRWEDIGGDLVRTVPPADADATVMTLLREWQSQNEGQLPSINKVQEIDGKGRSRAIRLRDLLAADRVEVKAHNGHEHRQN
jgi:hypothetical protein